MLTFCLTSILPGQIQAEFLAGTALVDVTPTMLPVLVNGSMTSRSVDKIKTRVHARALVLDDQKTKLAIVVVDSCMMPRPLLDEAKALAAKMTGIPTDRILISATHSHSAPSSMACLGTDADPNYVPFLIDKIAEAVAVANSKLQPAQVGFAKTDAGEFTASRQWIRQPGKNELDPFGNPTVRANMHAGANWDIVTGEAGPEDPDLSLISFQTRAGKPLAVLGNFSMHYFGDADISADYFGLFCAGIKQRLAGDDEFVGLMSHGCSGDIWRRDYTRPETWDPKLTIENYTAGLLDLAETALKSVTYQHDIDLAMAETRMTLNYRVPNKQLLEWSQRIKEKLGDKLPQTTEEIYALEQIILHERQQTEIVVQALRIGDIAIATTPNETYAVTGLKLKAASPIHKTMVIELANGGDGYIPPPEQHPLGGYNTWAARSAGLEVMAEPKIVEAGLLLLEQVAGQSRRDVTLSRGPAAAAIAKSQPVAWYRLDDFAGPYALDAVSGLHDGLYEPGITFYLEGPQSNKFCLDGQKNRAAMLCGGRVRSRIVGLGDQYSISLWLWNGMPNNVRDVTGWLFSRGHDHGLSTAADHLGIGGTSGHAGRLIFQHGNAAADIVAGKTEIPRWTWQHVVLVRDGAAVRIYLNGQLELETTAPAQFPRELDKLFFGGRSDSESNWEGRLDEVSIFNRALTAADISSLTP